MHPLNLKDGCSDLKHSFIYPNLCYDIKRLEWNVLVSNVNVTAYCIEGLQALF